MAILDELTEGWTGRREYTLMEKIGDEWTPFAIDPSWDVVLLLRGKDQSDYVETSGDVEVEADQDTYPGKVYVDFDTDDLAYTVNPYDARFRITDDAGKVEFFPNGKADKLYVHRP